LASGGRPLHVSVGNFNVDVVLYVGKMPGRDESVNAVDAHIGPGGAATNYAVAVARYGHRAALIAAASRSPLASAYLEEVKRLGVDVSGVKLFDAPPGLVVVIVLPGGERSMIRVTGANTFLSPEMVDRGLLEEARVVHMATLGPEKAIRVAEAAGGGRIVSYDPGFYAGESPELLLQALRLVDILFLNRDEYAKIGKRLRIEDLLAAGPRVVVVKLGERGAVAVTAEGEKYYAYAEPLGTPIDATGAGDAFDAFFNAAYLDLGDVGEALRYAAAAGAMKTLCRGATLCWDSELFSRHLERSTVRRLKEPVEKLIGEE